MIDPRTIPLLGRPFYFLRHGHTTSNRDGTVAGGLDVELTETGREQARAAIALVAPLGVTAVYCSALRRSRDTAVIIATAIGLPVRPIAGLNERNWGELEGKPRALRTAGFVPGGAESREACLQRVATALAGIPAGGVPLVVAHSGTFRVICELIGREQEPEPIANCQPVLVAPERGGWRIETVLAITSRSSPRSGP